MFSVDRGAAIAMVITNTTAPLIIIAYVRARNLHRKTWGGWSWASLQEWSLFAKLGVPGLFMLIFEWWSIEVAAFVAGSISETELAVNSILFQILVVLFMVRLKKTSL